MTRTTTIAKPHELSAPRVFPHASDPPPEDWRRYVDALRRHKRLLLLSALAGLLLGAAVRPWLRATYRVSAALIADGRGADGRAVLQPGAWRDVVRSYSVLEAAARRTRTFLHPATGADAQALAEASASGDVVAGQYVLDVSGDGTAFVLRSEDRVLQRGAVGDPIGAGVGLTWAPPCCTLPAGGQVHFGLATMRDAAQALRGGLDVSVSPDGQLLHLALEGADPQRLVTILGAIVDEALRVGDRVVQDARRDLADRLRGQLEQADSTLADIAQAQAGSRTTPGGVGVDGVNPRLAEYQRQVAELARATADQEAIARALTLATPADQIAALEVIPAVAAAPALSAAFDQLHERRAAVEALRERYTPRHPDVLEAERAVQLAEDRIPVLAADLRRSLARRAETMEGDLRERSGALRAVAAQDAQVGRLTREAERAGERYGEIRRQYQAAALPSAAPSPLRVLDAPAIVRNPVQHRGPEVLLLGMLAGLGLGGVGVIVVERLSPRVQHPEQVSFEMGVPVLGAIPHLPGTGALKADASARLREAFRGVRLGLIHAHGGLPLAVTITSPEQGEGKSFVAANLAVALADAGHATLLVDGDTRRARLHHLLGVRRGPGLADVLLGTVAPLAAIQPSQVTGLDLLAAGTLTTSAPELFESANARDLMAALAPRYAAVVVDSPPMTAGIDALVLAALTGELVVVFRAGSTLRELADVKLRAVRGLPIRVLGAVLNDVRNRDDYRRYSYYLPGYEPEDAIGRLPPALR